MCLSFVIVMGAIIVLGGIGVVVGGGVIVVIFGVNHKKSKVAVIHKPPRQPHISIGYILSNNSN